ncbi:hypothetical protein A4H97_02945 [Niastella yeongjuensis]|uniref:Uncharacterized protein n=1 Tax=Niastella yeongjuensis TaxID=354355 RepID=A0A1V9EXE0_9BACT|nr:hypothetical protein [Niastella yeongjuensis]OQP50797.1 hypothetical protein A4H97_02945 [Niastella yeongjuensis]SEN17269.1 hypothetical protein SAMN05660816_00353 [Niastella yeongjuensis]
MDSKLVKQYGTEILSYRLRTVRQKKRMQYEDFDKKLLRLKKERNRLYRQEKDLGYEPLIPPVQKGWKRFFVLREDVARSKHAEFFENILKKINTYDWSYRKDFRVRKRRYGRNKYGVKTQALLRPYEDHFQRLNFTDVEKSFFYPALKMDHKGRFERYFVFSELWRFVLRVRPNMIDKVKRRDEVIEKRLAEIEDYLEWNNYKCRLEKLTQGDCWRRKWRDDFRFSGKNPCKNRPIHLILQDIDEGLL